MSDASIIDALFGPVVKNSDVYYTPTETVEALLLADGPPPHSSVLDPAAGNGAILRVCREHGFSVEAVEIREKERGALLAVCNDPAAVVIDNWLNLAITYEPISDAIITNPPFSIGPAFAVACLKTGCPYVALLLRCNVIGSNSWRPIWNWSPPNRIRPVKRPSFDAPMKKDRSAGDGRVDAAEYAWFIWDAYEEPINLKPI